MTLFDRSRSASGEMRDDNGGGVAPEGYLTDGRRLLFAERVARRGGGEPVVVLEDCRTLEVIVCAIHEFRALRLRPVAGGRFGP
jgi:hypothetical protein